MSKYYELLQKMGKEQDVLPTAPPEGSQNQPLPAAAPMSAETAAGYSPASAPDNQGLEEINAVVQQVFLLSGTGAPRTVVLVGSEPGTGCTWVCAHLAQMLASRVAASVCVVDANLGAPALHTQFGVENGYGLAEALAQLDPVRSFARPLSLPNLWLISAGAAGENAQAMLASDRMRLRITELRSEFDFVLIDAPALGASNGAIALGSISDGVILVLKANASRRETAKQAIDDLQAANAKVLGAVLNQRTYPIPSKIYKKL